MSIGIRAIEYTLPDITLDNQTLAELYPEWTAEKIYKKTGIASRHVLAEGECISDIAQRAAEKLFACHGVLPKDIDFLIMVTENPDYILPPTACILQHRLGLPRQAGALDVNLGCSGFVYGLKLAKALIASGEAENVLLLTADGYSRRIHPLDKSTRTIFGDGAAATLVTADTPLYDISSFDVGTDGSGFENLIIPAGGLKQAVDSESSKAIADDTGNQRSAANIFMEGTEIFNFTLSAVPASVNAVLEKNGVRMEDIDWFIFHQANRYILDFLRKKMKIPSDRFIINMEDTGNTVSATIPIAIKRCENQALFMPEDSILLCGFGVGLSWGSVILKRNG